MRFAPGEYEKECRYTSQNYARVTFLRAVGECEPEVWQTLVEGKAGSLYKQYIESQDLFLEYHLLKEWADAASIGKALDAWAKTWHLSDEWCKEQALRFIEFFHYYPDTEGAGGWILHQLPGKITKPDERRFTFEHPGDDLTRKSRKQIEDEIRQAFETELEAYIQSMLGLCEQRGFVPVPKKYDDRHFLMLARYQVQGWTHEMIRKEYGYKDVGSIAHIIPDTARFIGLTLRKGRGRPRSK